MADMQIRKDRSRNRRQSSHDDSSDSEAERRRRRRRERRNGEENQGKGGGMNQVEGVQIKVPTFMGMNNPEAYLEWEMKIEQGKGATSMKLDKPNEIRHNKDVDKD
ncbi:hypothetical protein Lal_00043609 [Lupinus albus]|nr:hypothetical protein Lal_00043609 [Lupinus albus]